MSQPDLNALAGLLGQVLGGGNANGLGAFTDRLRQNGLGPEVDSWIGNGANQPVAPDRLAAALGPQQLGVQGGSGGGMAGVLAALLPVVVNALTPQGRLPQRDEELPQGGLAGLLGAMGGGQGAPGGGGLGGLLGQLMGGGAGQPAQPQGGLGALLGGLMGGGAEAGGGGAAQGATDGRAYGKFGPGEGGRKG
jgi:uncharacterized protein YidB (DUF937 family)